MPETEQAVAPKEKQENTDEKPPKPKKSIKPKILMIIGAQVVLSIAGFLFVTKFIAPDPAFQRAREEKKKEEAPAHVEVKREVYPIEDVVVNPAGTSGSRYLSVSIGVEMDAVPQEGGGEGHGAPAKTASPLDEKKLQLRDAMINILSSKTIEQLTNSAEKENIRTEITQAFNRILGEGKVHQIYFVEFVLQ